MAILRTYERKSGATAIVAPASSSQKQESRGSASIDESKLVHKAGAEEIDNAKVFQEKITLKSPSGELITLSVNDQRQLNINGSIVATDDIVSFAVSPTSTQTVYDLIRDYLDGHSSELGGLKQCIINLSGTGNCLSSNITSSVSLDGKTLTLGFTAFKAYEMPTGGIPKTDLDSTVKSALSKANTAYQKPLGGIPATDLSTAIQTSLSKADTALQEHQDISELTAHLADESNPHKVTKAQVGLGNCNNTSDLNKPISTATQTALNNKANKSEWNRQTLAGTSDAHISLNDVTTNGVYRINTYVDNKPVSSDYGQMLVVNGGNDTLFQLYMPYDKTKLYIRSGNTSKTSTAGISKRSWTLLTTSDEVLTKIDAAIASLDVTDVAEDGKYVTAVNETEGKVSTTKAYVKQLCVEEGSLKQLVSYNTISKLWTLSVATSSGTKSFTFDKDGKCTADTFDGVATKVKINSNLSSVDRQILFGLNNEIYGSGEAILINPSLGRITAKQYKLADGANIATLSVGANGITADKAINGITASKVANYDSHIASVSNPHSVTKSQVGLSNVDNTSDLQKPISTKTQKALDNKADKSDWKRAQIKGTTEEPINLDTIVENGVYRVTTNVTNIPISGYATMRVDRGSNTTTLVQYYTADTGETYVRCGSTSGTFSSWHKHVSESDIDAKIASEATARNTAITNAINAEITARNAKINEAIADEVSNRNNAIDSKITTARTAITAQLTNAVGAEASARQSAIDSAISTEVTNRNKAITTKIDAEVTARTNAINTAISNEVKARNTTINEAIADEVKNRNTAITNAITSEATARNTAISDAIGALDFTDIEVSGYFVTAVNEQNGKISVTRKTLGDVDAKTAEKLKTPRALQIASFDGSNNGTSTYFDGSGSIVIKMSQKVAYKEVTLVAPDGVHKGTITFGNDGAFHFSAPIVVNGDVTAFSE